MPHLLKDQPLKPFEPDAAFPLSLVPVLNGSPGESAAPLANRRKPKIGYLLGSDLNDRIVHDPKQRISINGSTNCDGLRVTDKNDYWRIHVTKGYYRQKFRYGLHDYDTLLNLVTEPDQHPRVLRNMVRMVEGYQGRIINHPAIVLTNTREEVARRCADLPNVRAPKSIRLPTSNEGVVRKTLADAEFAFPALVRKAGTHDGDFVGLASDIDALLALLQPRQEHIVTEFVDYRGEDGLYRKYRMFFFGAERVFRHMLASDQWNIHAGNGNPFVLERPALLAEERRLIEDADGVLGPVVIQALEAIRAQVGLDFMGIDFSFTPEGEVLLFEANAAMGFFPFLDDERVQYRKGCLPRAQHAFETLIGVR